ncbi:MAG: hypothetical protein KC620_26450, partial [Myxococcales bacterium]|nr:hypothetical protein [Myxococcales bacterium]
RLMGSLTGATARAAALLKVGSVAPAADRDHPNHLGANHRMVFRLVLGRTQAVIGEYTFAMAPSRISRTPSVRMAIHETAAGRTVDMPRDAEGQVHYVISGTTGFWPSGAGPNAPDGMAELHALKAIFDAFINPTAIGFARDDLELHWINPDEPVTAFDHVGDAAYLVVPAGNGVEVHRQAGSANFNYTIRLIAIGRVRQPRVDRSRRAEARRLSLLQRVRAALGALQAYSFDTLFAQYQLLIAPYAQVITLVGDVRAFLEGWVSGVDTWAKNAVKRDAGLGKVN